MIMTVFLSEIFVVAFMSAGSVTGAEIKTLVTTGANLFLLGVCFFI